MRFKFDRDFYIPPNSVELVLADDAVAYVWFTGQGKPGAAIFFGKQAKPYSNFYYRNYAALDNALALAVESRNRVAAYKAERVAARKNFVHDCKVGDIYRTCWGYEQTNVEFFEVTEVKGKHAILREIGGESGEEGWLLGRKAPLPGSFLTARFEGDEQGIPIRRLIQNGQLTLHNLHTASPMKGTEIAGVKVYESVSWTAYH